MTDRSEPTAPDLTRGGVTVPGVERQRCEIMSRVVGYLRPVSAGGRMLFNPGKYSEFRDRKYFRPMEQERMRVR